MCEGFDAKKIIIIEQKDSGPAKRAIMKNAAHTFICAILAFSITTPILAQRPAQILLHGYSRRARIIDIPGLTPSNPIVSVPISRAETIYGALVGIPPTIPGYVFDQEVIFGRESEAVEYMRMNLPPAGSARRARFGCYLTHSSRSVRPSVFTVFYPLSRQIYNPVTGYDRLTCYIITEIESTTAVWVAIETSPRRPREERLLLVPMGDIAESGFMFGDDVDDDNGSGDDNDNDNDDDGGGDGGQGRVVRIKEAHILDGPMVYRLDLEYFLRRGQTNPDFTPNIAINDWAYCWFYDENGVFAEEVRYATRQNPLNLLCSGLRCYGASFEPTDQHERLE